MSCLCPFYGIFEMCYNPKTGFSSYASLMKKTHTKQSNTNVQFEKCGGCIDKDKILISSVNKQ